jgi:hypothetical protein
MIVPFAAGGPPGGSRRDQFGRGRNAQPKTPSSRSTRQWGSEVEPGTGRFLRANAAMCEFVGYSEAELLARTEYDITHPDDCDLDTTYARWRVRWFRHGKRYIRKKSLGAHENEPTCAQSSGPTECAAMIRCDMGEQGRKLQYLAGSTSTNGWSRRGTRRLSFLAAPSRWPSFPELSAARPAFPYARGWSRRYGHGHALGSGRSLQLKGAASFRKAGLGRRCLF